MGVETRVEIVGGGGVLWGWRGKVVGTLLGI